MLPRRLLLSTLFLISYFIGARTDGGYDSYTPDTYPDSTKEFRACRVTDPSLVCDPNHILNDPDNREGIEMIHRALTKVREDTNCSCTPEDMQLGSCYYPKVRGYTVSVAVLNRVQDAPYDSSDPETKKQKVATFGNALRLRFYRGQCSDDAFIVLSANDSTVWTSVGEVMNRKLTPELINSVTIVAEEFFVKKEYTEGLLYMIDMYMQILQDKHPTIVSPNAPFHLPIPLWLLIVIGVVILLVLIAIISGIVLCCIRKSKTRGYEVGRERPYSSRTAM